MKKIISQIYEHINILQRQESLSLKQPLSRQVSIRSESSNTITIDTMARENAADAIAVTHAYNLINGRKPNKGKPIPNLKTQTHLEDTSTTYSALHKSPYKPYHKINEDFINVSQIAINDSEFITILGVHDGHGPKDRNSEERSKMGYTCSKYLGETMEKTLPVLIKEKEMDILEAYKTTLKEIEEHFKVTDYGKEAGTTFLSVAIKETPNTKELSIINVGDSRAILLKGYSTDLTAECLTIDQDFTHLTNEDWATIKKNGGEFSYSKFDPITKSHLKYNSPDFLGLEDNDYKLTYIRSVKHLSSDQEFDLLLDDDWSKIKKSYGKFTYCKTDTTTQETKTYTSDKFLGRLYKNEYKLTDIKISIGSLNMNATVGNQNMKLTTDSTGQTWPISSLPNIYRRTVEDHDQFVLLASDGLWAVSTPKEVADFISTEIKKGTQDSELAGKLTEYAYQCGSTDDLSVVIHRLNPKKEKSVKKPTLKRKERDKTESKTKQTDRHQEPTRKSARTQKNKK
jgi:serine/threonine protein phosphatase PrpC